MSKSNHPYTIQMSFPMYRKGFTFTHNETSYKIVSKGKGKIIGQTYHNEYVVMNLSNGEIHYYLEKYISEIINHLHDTPSLFN